MCLGAAEYCLETGLLSTWLFHELRKQELPVICIDARHAKAALSLRINKTDTNDAHGIAQIVRVSWYREVVVKSMDNHTLRAMLSARAHLVAQSVTLANAIRGLLKVFGLVVRRAKGGRFEDLVRTAIADQPTTVVAIIEPLLAVLIATREQLAGYERIVRRRARADETARRLMTVPGVGTVVALAFVSTIEDPDRFKRSSSVGAYLGLTPRRYQSGDSARDCTVPASKLQSANESACPSSTETEVFGALPRRSRAFLAIAGETSAAMIWPAGPTAARAASAESPAPVAMSRTCIPGATWAARNTKGMKCAVTCAKARSYSAAASSLKASSYAIARS